MPPSAESLEHRALDKQQPHYFHFHIPLIPNHTFFFFHFNIPEIEMGLAIDDKKAPCHSLIGGSFFPFREVHKSLCLQLPVSLALRKQNSSEQGEVLPQRIGPALQPENTAPTLDLIQDKSSVHLGVTGSFRKQHICIHTSLQDSWSERSQGHGTRS